MKLRWTPEAAAELEEIRDYLLFHQPEFALSTVRTLYEAATSLRQMPSRGRIGKRAGTRELPILPLPYFIIYRIEESAVIILAFRHTSRDAEPS